MFTYTLPVHAYTAQHAHFAPVAISSGYPDLATDHPHNPTQITVCASSEAAALRIAQRHLTLLRARRAYINSTVVRTAADTVYARARARAETLTPDQREEECNHAIHTKDDELRIAALFDVRHEKDELPS